MKSSEEAFAISLFGLLGGSLKQSSTKDSGFLSSRVFERVVEAVNNVDVSDGNVSTAIDARTPKSQRIAILEKELKFYRDRVREVELSISAVMETPPETTLPLKLLRSTNLESVVKKFAWTHHQETRNEIGLWHCFRRNPRCLQLFLWKFGSHSGLRIYLWQSETPVGCEFSSFRSRRYCCPKQRTQGCSGLRVYSRGSAEVTDCHASARLVTGLCQTGDKVTRQWLANHF